MPEISGNAAQFNKVYEVLTDQPRTPFFENMKTKLPQLIQNPSQFNTAFEKLSPEHCTYGIKIIQDKLPQIFKPGLNFINALKDISSKSGTTTLLFEKNAEEICNQILNACNQDILDNK